MDFIEELRNLSNQIVRQQDHATTEEATKHAFVIPFIKILGYDPYNLTGAFQRIMMECKFNSYSVNPTSAYLTLTALLETARWKAGGNGACLRT